MSVGAKRAIDRRSRARGLTLLEVLIAVAILALVATLIYGAFDGMQKSRDGLTRINDRYHQARTALSRMSRELESAFISFHTPLVAAQSVRMTAFVGRDSNPDRVDFTSFSHLRIGKNSHESDQNEIGYFLSKDPDVRDKLDLVRREAKYIDLDPANGGVLNVLCEDVQSFNLQYLDPYSQQWVDSWDSMQAAGQPGRLPQQVRITLELKPGLNYPALKLTTRTTLAMQMPLTFAIGRP